MADLSERRAVAVLNGYSKHNVGDWLLFAESVELARELGAERVIAVAMDTRSFEDTVVADALVPAPVRPEALVRGMLETAVALVTAGRAGAPGLRALRHCRSALSVGGGFLQFRGLRELLTICAVHGTQWAMCARLGVPFHVLPQSIGPFSGRGSATIARWLLRRADTVFVRDELSRTRLRELGVTERVELLPDLAFYGSQRPWRPAASPLRVGLVTRRWWFPGSADPEAAEERYVRACASAAERLVAAGHEVVLVVHSDGPTERGDDAIISRRIAAAASVPLTIEAVTDARTVGEVEDRYARFDAIATTRLHAALLALRAGTPAIGIAYETKTSEIFGQLGLGDWWFDIAAVTDDDLVGAVDRLDAYPRDEVAARFVAQHDELRRRLAAVEV